MRLLIFSASENFPVFQHTRARVPTASAFCRKESEVRQPCGQVPFSVARLEAFPMQELERRRRRDATRVLFQFHRRNWNCLAETPSEPLQLVVLTPFVFSSYLQPLSRLWVRIHGLRFKFDLDPRPNDSTIEQLKKIFHKPKTLNFLGRWSGLLWTSISVLRDLERIRDEGTTPVCCRSMFLSINLGRIVYILLAKLIWP